MLGLPVSLLVAHFIGDFILQSNWMAINKSKNWGALWLHVMVYMLCFSPWGFSFMVVTACTHFLTDAVTSRWTSKLWFIDLKKVPAEINGVTVGSLNDPDDHYKLWYWMANVNDRKRHWFFVVIGLDQLIHAMTLALTYKLLYP